MNKNDIRFGFLLLPGFSLAALGGFSDLLGLLENPAAADGWSCRWEIVADTLIPVRCATGIQVAPTHLLGDPARFDVIVVVGGILAPPAPLRGPWLSWLRNAARGGRTLVGLCSGVFALAQAGVMANARLCVDGDHYRAFLAQFPHIAPEHIMTDRQYVFDRHRITCAGGPAVLDVAARLLRRRMPAADVRRALRRLQTDDTEHHSPIQPPPPDIPAEIPPAVQRAALMMEQYAGEPLSVDELADRLGVSARQLQRLFRQHLGITPQSYARRVRLRLAAWMLEHSDKSIAAIASDCGYADAAHMSRSFRAEHGVAPGAWRLRATR